MDIKIIFETWIALGFTFIGLWFMYIGYLAKTNNKRRCLRVWLGLTSLTVAAENLGDAFIPWSWQAERMAMLYIKAVVVTICAVYIIKMFKVIYDNHGGS